MNQPQPQQQQQQPQQPPGIDTNIKNYSNDDLRMLLNLQEDFTEYQVKDIANTIIAKMKTEKNVELQKFFEKVRDKLIQNVREDNEYNNLPPSIAKVDSSSIIVDTSWANFSAPDQAGASYYTNGSRVVLNDDNKKYAEASRTISTRIVCIDSQFRTNILPFTNNSLQTSFTTNFAFNLANPINDAVSYKLYSYQIPTTWYALNSNVGNTFFQYNGIIIQVPDGNYTIVQLIDKINAIALLDIASAFLHLSYPDPNTGKISITNNDTLTESALIYFYVQANTANIYKCSQELLRLFQTVGINNTLGWLLGFRTTPDFLTGDVYLTINSGQTVQADVLPDVYGPKYFTLSVEEYGPRLSSGLTSITHTKQLASLTVPEYNKTKDLDCRLREGNLTQAQLYTINTILRENASTNTINVTNQALGPNIGDTFAVIPLRDIPNIRPNPYVQFGGDTVIHERKFAQPFRMERVNVQLLDDKGNLVDLHDNDWSFSLIVDAVVG